MANSPDTLYTRAGGGESFGGGGYSDGSSGGSSFSTSSFSSSGISSGGGSPSCFTCVVILVVVVFIVILLIQDRRRRGRGGGNNGGQGGYADPTNSNTNSLNRSMGNNEVSEQLNKLKELDPAFDEQKFKSYVKKVFMSVQQGWTERDQIVCRPFMAEDVYQSHEMQIVGMKRNKTINVLENIVVGSVDIARIDIGAEYHKIAVKIRAAMTDYKVKEDAPEKVIDGNKTQTPPFTEYWIFIRKATIKTKVKDGIFDRKCPNCGAPIEVDVAGICKFCKANVVNGDYDWVLSEIVQTSEWRE